MALIKGIHMAFGGAERVRVSIQAEPQFLSE